MFALTGIEPGLACVSGDVGGVVGGNGDHWNVRGRVVSDRT